MITYILYDIFFKFSNLQDTLNKLAIALPFERIILNRDNIGLEPITHRFYLIFAACVFNAMKSIYHVGNMNMNIS